MKLPSKFKQSVLATATASTLLLTQAQYVFAADAGEVQSKLTDAANTVKSVLTALVVLVGIVVALWIIIKRMPDADDPREKSEVYKSVGRVAGLVGLARASPTSSCRHLATTMGL